MVVYIGKEGLAAFLYVIESLLEIICIPRIGHIAGTVGKIQQFADAGMGTKNPPHVIEIRIIHTEKEVVVRGIGCLQLPCTVRKQRYAFAY